MLGRMKPLQQTECTLDWMTIIVRRTGTSHRLAILIKYYTLFHGHCSCSRSCWWGIRTVLFCAESSLTRDILRNRIQLNRKILWCKCWYTSWRGEISTNLFQRIDDNPHIWGRFVILILIDREHNEEIEVAIRLFPLDLLLSIFREVAEEIGMFSILSTSCWPLQKRIVVLFELEWYECVRLISSRLTSSVNLASRDLFDL